MARERGAFVIYGGIHATLFPDEARERGAAHAVVSGDGDVVWRSVLADAEAGTPSRTTTGGASTARGSSRRDGICCRTAGTCGRRCRPCAAVPSTARSARSGEPTARRRAIAAAASRRRGDRRAAAPRIPVHRAGRRQFLSGDASRISRRPRGMRITTRLRRARGDARRPLRADGAAGAAAGRHRLLHANHDGGGRGSGVPRCDAGRAHQGRAGRRRIGDGRRASRPSTRTSISRETRSRRGCARSASTACTCSARSSSDSRAIAPDTFDATAALAREADLTFAQFVMLTPFPGHGRLREVGAKLRGQSAARSTACPITRHWLIPAERRPKFYMAHPTMQRRRDSCAHAGRVGSSSTSPANLGAQPVRRVRARPARVLLISKLYRQMYANTGIATDSARRSSSVRWARWLSRPCRRLFAGTPMPDLQMPTA